MPASPNKSLRECRANIDLMLTRGLKRTGPVRYKDVVREAVIHYDVTQAFVEKFIKEFYIDEEIVILEDGLLSLPKNPEAPQ